MHAIGFGARFSVNRPARAAVPVPPGPPAFDFTGGVLPAGASFARPSGATWFDGAGTLVSVGADVARCGAAGVLIEPGGDNRLPCSSDWTNLAWARKYAGGTAQTLIEDATAGAIHQARQDTDAFSYTAGQTATMSAVGREYVGPHKRYLVLYLAAAPVFAGTCDAIFDLANGTVTGSSNAVAAGTVAIGNGAWLCWVSGVAVSTGTAQVAALRLSDSATLDHAYSGDGASGATATHIQIEPGGVATSRILTNGAVATRAPDAVTLDWRARGVAEDAITVRYTFDDGSTQNVATTLASGRAAVPTTLARRWLRRAEKL